MAMAATTTRPVIAPMIGKFFRSLSHSCIGLSYTINWFREKSITGSAFPRAYF